MRVSDLMHESPNVTPADNWIEVVKAISKFALGAVNVVNKGRLVGIVTDGDLRRTIESTAADSLGSLTAEEMMTSNPIGVAPDTLAYDALQIMENRPSQISVLPVVDVDGKCIWPAQAS
jgi:arabinose-5-phosphate isomerase